MPTRDEIERIAAAMNAIRPAWAVRSLVTYLERNHHTRPYRDLAVAAIIVALDERTQTPKLLEQHGPWWTACAPPGETSGPPAPKCPKPGHTSYNASNCGACRSETLEATAPRDIRPGGVPMPAHLRAHIDRLKERSR